MAAAKTTKTKEIVIPAIDIRHFTLKLVGDSPLIMHNWNEKAKIELSHIEDKPKTGKKELRNPVAEFIDSLYWMSGKPEQKDEEGFERAIAEGATFGFPATGFKASAVSGGYRSNITKDKVSMQAAFHINGEFVQIHGKPEIREDMVKIGMGVPDVRWRGEFKEWYALVPIRYNASIIDEAKIANLFNYGGFAVGIGEWRPEKGGTFGMYHVE